MFVIGAWVIVLAPEALRVMVPAVAAKDPVESSQFPATVCVNFTTFDDRVRETYMTVITLANTRLDQ